MMQSTARPQIKDASCLAAPTNLPRKKTSKLNIALLMSFVVIVLSTAFSRPFERYPLNDEWAYGYPVQSLISAGKLFFPTTTSFACAQIAIAVPFCSIFGFSYGLLRLIGVCCALVATYTLFLVVKELGLSKKQAGLLSFVFAANPFVLCLANSFMTDVPAAAFNCLMFLFLIKGMKRDRYKYWILGSIFLCCSIACRQTSLLFLPAIFGMLVLRFVARKSVLFPSIAMILAPVATYFAVSNLVKVSSIFPEPATSYQSSLLFAFQGAISHPTEMFFAVWRGVAIGACYLGLFCLPLLLPCAVAFHRRGNLKPALLSSLVSILIVGLPLLDLVYFKGALMPFAPNLFAPPFLGAYCLLGQMPVHMPEFWSKGFTFLTSLCALVFASVFTHGFLIQWRIVKNTAIRSIKSVNKRVGHWAQFSTFNLISLGCISAFLILQTSVHNLDRYYLSILPTCLCTIALVWKGFNRSKFFYGFSLICCLAIGCMGIVECLDFHSFARTREKCILSLLDRGIPAKDIDGGPEFNLASNIQLLQTYKFDPRKPHEAAYLEEARGSELTRKMRWWPITDEKYVIALQELPGFRIEFAAKYFSPLAGQNVIVYALRKVK